ncbi:L-proline cis-4-hydroxylase [Kordia antarctica]|uniref:L-proline cis-4-hydroxylase n=1 Tax=Kordia antarctica TaxID=1218801 RepID=A0A7L4ZHR5_9FLAO|nr:aspartyl/asparaginyl beta-hydroxylase domain-containing protein [Kordia antarctica]QHI36273.1 L-proline cis-4-hydroxylase [Kordia antarctica]
MVDFKIMYTFSKELIKKYEYMEQNTPKTGYLLFPFTFDVKALQVDLATCMKFNFLENYVPTNYAGKDYILPLRSVDGTLDSAVATENQASRFKNTVVLDECPYFDEVINSFLCDKEAVRLMNLPAGKIVNTHIDYNGGYEDGIFRVHIPVITNDEVFFILNDERLQMRSGEAWYTNINLPHGVENNGTTHRVHLVIDCIRNDWSDELFFSLAPKESFFPSKEEESPETLQRMIDEFKNHQNPVFYEIIAEFEEKLKTFK